MNLTIKEKEQRDFCPEDTLREEPLSSEKSADRAQAHC